MSNEEQTQELLKQAIAVFQQTSKMLDSLLSNQDSSKPELLTEEQTSQRFNLSKRKLQSWRENNKLTLGVHWVKIDGSVRYIPEMVRDRLINWEDDAAHLTSIEAWKKQQLCSAKSRRKSNAA